MVINALSRNVRMASTCSREVKKLQEALPNDSDVKSLGFRICNLSLRLDLIQEIKWVQKEK